MITYKTGNILDADVQALVNTVNTVGVMGKGIALQFKKAFPDSYKIYLRAVKNGEIQIGKVQVIPVNTLSHVEYIINFPTKGHWRFPSRLDWIKKGLDDLKDKLIRYNVKSVAIPPLGCGHGNLDWSDVKPLIEDIFINMPINVVIFEPGQLIQEALKKETKSEAPKLTPARAMLLYLLYQYRALGEFASEFAAEKLSYFLQRFGERQLQLQFVKGFYGPYSGKVRHVLYELNGYYLKGYEQKDRKPFEPLEIIMEKTREVKSFIDSSLSREEQNRLRDVASFIEGFESPYGLELLATVDFLAQENNTLAASFIREKIEEWSDRKKIMFPVNHIQLAIDHLSDFKDRVNLYPGVH